MCSICRHIISKHLPRDKNEYDHSIHLKYDPHSKFFVIIRKDNRNRVTTLLDFEHHSFFSKTIKN